MKRPMILAAALVLAGLAFDPAAAAERCRGSSFAFRFQGETVDTTVETGTGGCDVVYRAFGQSVFTTADIAAAPKYGSLTRIGNFSFAYQPKNGRGGADGFTIKICGHGRSPTVGCSKIRYAVDVR